ncbi:MAG: polysaccharide deacetylase family protein [Gemmatimonadaceae bacterium]
MKAVLTYHSIDDSGSAISVDPVSFRMHLKWLSGRGIPVVPLRSILASAKGTAVALTFDDGFRNFDDVALPVLREYGFPASLFVVPGNVGKTNAWSGSERSPGIPTLPLLDWAGIARAAGHGIEIGAHSRSHPFLSRITPSRLHDEIVGAGDDIDAELGIRPQSFCYPYGDFNAAVVQAAAAAYNIAVTTELREIDDGPVDSHLVPRIDMYYFRNQAQLESFGTPAFSRYLRLRRVGRTVRGLVSGALGW